MKLALAIGAIVLAVGVYAAFVRLRSHGVKPPSLWSDGESIYDFVARNIDPATGAFKQDAGDLPDEEKRSEPGKPRWIAGGLDGVLGHHSRSDDAQQKATEVASWVSQISRTGSGDAQRKLYSLLLEDSLLEFLDPAIEQMVQQRTPVTPELRTFAQSIAQHSPDRGPVKFAISLLGIIRDPKDVEVITTLGRHEEFTLFAVVALTNALDEPEPALFELAQRVHGWGRIHVVERLAETKNPTIKRWLLCHGYDNRVMYEYLAYTCATAGDLHLALATDTVDAELLKAATDLLSALIAGGPARDINDYVHAASVSTDYVRHVSTAPLKLAHFIAAQSLRDYLRADAWDAAARKKNGWTPANRDALVSAAENYLDRREWPELTRQGLVSADESVFYEADIVARQLGLDTWEVHWRRLQAEPGESGRWYAVMAQANAERIDAIIRLAESRLPLDEIASGPADEMGVGPGFKFHSALDMILQSMEAYSGKGRALLLAGLRSPVVRNRNMALKALAAWRAEDRDADTIAALRKAAAEEPRPEVKERIERLLTGKPLD